MSASDLSDGDAVRLPASRGVDPFLDAKLHWPSVRERWVDRRRLLDLFDEATRRPVTLVAAPAGYGKTTLSAQWLASRRGTRAAAWVSLDAADNDPGRPAMPLWYTLMIGIDVLIIWAVTAHPFAGNPELL